MQPWAVDALQGTKWGLSVISFVFQERCYVNV